MKKGDHYSLKLHKDCHILESYFELFLFVMKMILLMK